MFTAGGKMAAPKVDDITKLALATWAWTHYFDQIVYVRHLGMFFARLGPYSGCGFTVEMALMEFRKETR